ncbi:MAG TPA: NrfD/PsrC family molybdoenzyme membrane anchor subunit [Gemmatimonadales bacterium]|nr:NrfD/PsrC family molybdoenzyme membrane anchor subunit [Gemmatimonadales bacterium]
MSDTFFTASPHWTWWIILYFFVGGIAGGAVMLATLLRFFGKPEDQPIARLGYYLGVGGVVVSGLLLTIDLERPLRFWHMLLQSHTGLPMFKAWAPMSVGAWGLMLFGGFTFLAAAGAAAEEGRLPWPRLRILAEGTLGRVIGVLATGFGLFIAGYTGVLLAVSNRPIWADSNWLGILFLFSAASTAAATLLLLATRTGHGASAGAAWLARFDRGALVLELLALIAFVVSLGQVARVLVGGWGVLLLLGVVGLGILTPLLRPEPHVRAARLVLVGGFLLRTVVLLASAPIHAEGAGVTLR